MKRTILLLTILLCIETFNFKQAMSQSNYSYTIPEQQNYQSIEEQNQQKLGNYRYYSSNDGYSNYMKSTSMARDGLNTFQTFAYTLKQTIDIAKDGFSR